VRFNGIVKNFGGVHALKGVSFSIKKGEIHGLIGENGAGKSTLIKICNGIFSPDVGTIIIDGNSVFFSSPSESESQGIRVVHQDLTKTLCMNMSVADNIFLGPHPITKFGAILDKKSMYQKAKEILKVLGIELDPKKKLGDCSQALQQLVLISRAIYRKAKFIILDEPTSSLSQNEVETLFGVMKNLKEECTTFLFVSHRLSEVLEICDNITVLKDGEYINTFENKGLTVEFLSKTMTGKKELSIEKKSEELTTKDNVVLEVRDVCNRKLGLNNVTFKLYEGEILGIAGLMGSGRTELLTILFGVNHYDSGEIILYGENSYFKSPKDAINKGLGFINEDRNLALFYNLNVSDNIAPVVIDHLSTLGWINSNKYFELSNKFCADLQISAPSLTSNISALSGGNQQKVVISRWLSTNPRILLCDEPTRGVDVGVKFDIRKKIINLSKSGISVLYISSDFDELLHIADRILLMLHGEIVKEFFKEEIKKMNSIDLNNEVNSFLLSKRSNNG
jgi:ribose transport system ATP-binding protein